MTTICSYMCSQVQISYWIIVFLIDIELDIQYKVLPPSGSLRSRCQGGNRSMRFVEWNTWEGRPGGSWMRLGEPSGWKCTSEPWDGRGKGRRDVLGLQCRAKKVSASSMISPRARIPWLGSTLPCMEGPLGTMLRSVTGREQPQGGAHSALEPVS